MRKSRQRQAAHKARKAKARAEQARTFNSWRNRPPARPKPAPMMLNPFAGPQMSLGAMEHLLMFGDLAERQQPLGRELMSIWNRHRVELYVTDPPSPEPQNEAESKTSIERAKHD